MFEGSTLFVTLLLGVAPIFELRGAIPYAYFNGVPLYVSALVGCGANLLVFPILSIFLNFFHSFFYKRLPFYQRFFDKTIIRIRKKVETKVALYGMVGITLFVAIPLRNHGSLQWNSRVVDSWTR